MQRSGASFVDLSPFFRSTRVEGGFLGVAFKFAPFLPGFLRDQLAMTGKLIGLFWPLELYPGFDWKFSDQVSEMIITQLELEKSPEFPIICLRNREDPKPFWDLKMRFDLTLWGSSYFTLESSSCIFAHQAGISKILSFPFDL